MKKFYELRNFTNWNRKNTQNAKRPEGLQPVSLWLNECANACHETQESQNIVVTHSSIPLFFVAILQNFCRPPSRNNELDIVLTVTPVRRPWHPQKNLECAQGRANVKQSEAKTLNLPSVTASVKCQFITRVWWISGRVFWFPSGFLDFPAGFWISRPIPYRVSCFFFVKFVLHADCMTCRAEGNNCRPLL